MMKTQETKIQNRRKNKMAGGPGSYVLGAEERKEVLDVLDGGHGRDPGGGRRRRGSGEPL